MSIEGYSNFFSNNIEGNSTDSILQGEIDLINYNITDITFDGTNTTTIDNNLTITGVLAIDGFTNVKTTLESYNTSINTINSTLTDISYTTDTTNISNNITIKEGKLLRFLNSSNASTTLLNATSSGQIYNLVSGTQHFFQVNGTTSLQIGSGFIQSSIPITAPTEAVGSNNIRLATTEFVTTATQGISGISYDNTGGIDMTTIDNNVTLSATKILNIDGYSNVKTSLDSFTTSINTINTTLTDISFSGDTTTINNNLTLSTGKILSIPSHSNVGTELTTLTTNATGITYSAPYPLYVPQTTISQNLILATNKKLTCDEIWNKLYTTHDLTDTIGVGYFKGFMYNNGSVFTISTVNPINVYDGTSSEIVLKCGSREAIFGLDGMCLNWGTITLCTDIQLPAYASLTGTLDTMNNTLNQVSTRLYEDDFIDGFGSNKIPWSITGTGTVAQIADESGYQGILRMTASNDRTLYPTSSNNIFYWTGLNRMDFFIRVNFTNSNVYYAVGLSDNNVGTGNTIVWTYQNTSPYDWSLRVNGLVVSGTSGVMTAATGEWLYGSIINTKVGARTLRAYLKNVNTGVTFDANIGTVGLISTTATYRPYFKVINTSGTGGKSLDIDYVSVDYAAVRPTTPV